MINIADPLWAHFKPLWLDFNAVGNDLLVAGGYGLFLKQQWLWGQVDPVIVVPLARWRDAIPRVTKDLDLVLGLDLIADKTANSLLLDALEKHGFSVSEKPQGKRWQFVKSLGEGREVIAELHAQAPTEGTATLKMDGVRVKHKPSLGDEGIHGRLNPEAVGGHINPSKFSFDNTEVMTPNAVTWSIMKLTAAEDRWLRSQDLKQHAAQRTFSRIQAIKHGHDVCRAVAMMTMEERDANGAVMDAIEDTLQFERPSAIYREFFAGAEDWANEVLADKWLPEDLEIIHGVLASWFAA